MFQRAMLPPSTGWKTPRLESSSAWKLQISHYVKWVSCQHGLARPQLIEGTCEYNE